ncbi:MAG: NAD(P)H-binding protein [Clostridia bacterium]|nr:NAD(P)H-binding protein [Clostridia bacterium]
MKIALIGATGFIGSRVLEEALNRGHEVTAISRHTGKITVQGKGLIPAEMDVYDSNALKLVLEGQDAVISAFNSGWRNPNLYMDYKRGYASILQTAKKANVKRLLVVGGAASLILPTGERVYDVGIPDKFKLAVQSPLELLEELKEEKELNWSFISPALNLTNETKTGKFRLGKDHPVVDEKGENRISVGDLAIAILDEIEHPQFIRQRFTVGY